MSKFSVIQNTATEKIMADECVKEVAAAALTSCTSSISTGWDSCQTSINVLKHYGCAKHFAQPKTMAEKYAPFERIASHIAAANSSVRCDFVELSNNTFPMIYIGLRQKNTKFAIEK